MCESLDAGADPVHWAPRFWTAPNPTTFQAAVFVVSAVDNCCPEYGRLFK